MNPLNPRLLGFIVRSLKASVRGDKMTHLLTVTTVCASLLLVGAVQLAQRNLVRWAEAWADDRAVVVFVAPAADEAARRDVRAAMSDAAGLDVLGVRTPAQSAADLGQVLGLGDAKGLEDFAPWVFEARRGEATDAAALAALRDREDVLHVDEGTVVAARVRNVAQSVRMGGTLLAVMLLLGAFLVVSNTVGLALNARRDEVEIMDLVGTPLVWIYAAYVSEGVLLGALGAGVAVALIELPLGLGAAAWLEALGMPPVARLSGSEIALLLAGGGGIGAAGSALSVRRFLRQQWA